MTAPDHVIVGRIRRAHGVRGEMAVELITDEPDAIFAPGLRVFAGSEHGVPARDPATGAHVTLHITGVRPFQDGALVTFAEITDRTVPEWQQIPAYAASLDTALGRERAAKLADETTGLLPGFAETARRLNDNFLQIVTRAAAR